MLQNPTPKLSTIPNRFLVQEKNWAPEKKLGPNQFSRVNLLNKPPLFFIWQKIYFMENCWQWVGCIIKFWFQHQRHLVAKIKTAWTRDLTMPNCSPWKTRQLLPLGQHRLSEVRWTFLPFCEILLNKLQNLLNKSKILWNPKLLRRVDLVKKVFWKVGKSQKLRKLSKMAQHESKKGTFIYCLLKSFWKKIYPILNSSQCKCKE